MLLCRINFCKIFNTYKRVYSCSFIFYFFHSQLKYKQYVNNETKMAHIDSKWSLIKSKITLANLVITVV